ncbi:MAG: hypothetical protein GQ572_10425 [Gammaproteobacteria bacterium]|nr:hypothetical protein [Gammaproteobacteria bacterium]
MNECFKIHYSLFTIHYSLFTIHYSLFTYINLNSASKGVWSDKRFHGCPCRHL